MLSHESPICTTLEARVLRAMHTKFGQNWSRTFRGDVENVNNERQTTTHEVGLVNFTFGSYELINIDWEFFHKNCSVV